MRLLAVAVVLLAVAGTAEAAPPVPGAFGAYPRYHTTPGITVRWNEVPGATRYDVHRSVDGGTYANVAQVAPVEPDAQRIYADPAVTKDHTYTYRVEACDASGCASTAPFTTAIRIVWPIAGGREVLNGFNEVIAWSGIKGGTAGTIAGYHDGVDLNRTTAAGQPGDQILAPRGGIVVAVDVTAALDDGFVAIAVDVGNFSIEFDSFNHIATTAGNQPPVAVGDVVAPGQVIARMGTEHFPGRFGDHVHAMVTTGSFVNTSARHYLRLFTAAEDRDPQGHPPALFDENQDDAVVLFRRHGQIDLLPHDADALPLDGDVDIAVEVTDQQGTNPRQAPIDLGYWIEGPLPSSVHHDDVRSAQSPYRLYDFRSAYFGDLRPCDQLALLNPDANAGCTAMIPGLGSSACVTDPGAQSACEAVIEEDEGGVVTPLFFPVLHHFLVSFAKGPAGDSPDNADPSQYWRTNALDDGQPPTTGGANYAGKPTTTRSTRARFPDGYYTIHAVASDLEHDAVDLPVPAVRLENFPPQIRRLRVAHDVDGVPGTGEDGCEETLYDYTYPGMGQTYPGVNHLALSQRDTFARAELPLCVRVRFSEPMHEAAVTFARDRGAGAPLGGIFLEPLGMGQARDTWRGRIELPVDPTGNSDSRLADGDRDVAIAVAALDQVDREGEQRRLDADDDGIPDVADDVQHLIKVDLSPPKKTVTIRKTR